MNPPDQPSKPNAILEALTDAINDSPDPLFVLLRTGHVVHANRSFDQLFDEVCPGGTIGHTLPEIFALDDELAEERLVANLRRGQDEPNLVVETGLTKANGETYRHEWHYLRRYDRSGMVNLVVVIGRDVTERSSAKQALAVANERLAESNRDLTEFAHVASHDLQEPLRKVIAFSERLSSHLGDDLDERGTDYMERLIRATERMQTLIADLLTLARVNTREVSMTTTNLEEVAKQVLQDLEVSIEESGATVALGKLPTVASDAVQMGQLFQNLIGNAVKFRQPDVSPEITISSIFTPRSTAPDADPDDGWFDISVSDNGIGFDDSYVDKIFSPFQRLHGRLEYEGSGVGLSVCRSIAERHHGTITASSEPGEGSTFTVRLPTAQPDDQPSPT